MNILVLLRIVRDPAGFTVNRKAQKIFFNRERFVVNPSDRNALEAALALAGADDTVTVAALGGHAAREALQMARAIGATRAVCVASPAELDPLANTRVIQALIRYLGGIDLVVLGSEVLDSDLAQVAPRLAAALDWQFVADACQISALPDGLGLVVSGQDGYRRLGADLPAVASVARDSNRPRFAPAPAIIRVFTDPSALETLTLTDLELDPASLAPVTVQYGESFPPERTLGRLADGDDPVRQIADALRGK
jgi:electron transfer flavoprotein beta subunit